MGKQDSTASLSLFCLPARPARDLGQGPAGLAPAAVPTSILIATVMVRLVALVVAALLIANDWGFKFNVYLRKGGHARSPEWQSLRMFCSRAME